jgi:hypothetical protein
MPLGREYRPVAGSVDVSGYPCIPKVAQAPLEPAMRFRTKAYVPMRLDTGGRGGQRDPAWPGRGTHAPPRGEPARGGDPLKFSPYFHGTGF